MTDAEKDPNNVPLRERPIAEVSDTLQRVLGQELVAFAIQEHNPARIDAFVRSEDNPSVEAEFVMRDLAEVTEILLERETDHEDVVRAIMIGANPNLNDFAPIELFHNGESERVVSVARQL